MLLEKSSLVLTKLHILEWVGFFARFSRVIIKRCFLCGLSSNESQGVDLGEINRKITFWKICFFVRW